MSERLTVWIRPTRFSPLCCFRFNAGTRKVTSRCGSWLTLYDKYMQASNPTQTHDVCRKCALSENVKPLPARIKQATATRHLTAEEREPLPEPGFADRPETRSAQRGFFLAADLEDTCPF